MGHCRHEQSVVIYYHDSVCVVQSTLIDAHSLTRGTGTISLESVPGCIPALMLESPSLVAASTT